MSYTAEQLISLTANYEQLAHESLAKTAAKKDKKKSNPKDKDSQSAKDKKSDKDSKKDGKKPFWLFKKKEKKSSLQEIESLLIKYAGY